MYMRGVVSVVAVLLQLVNMSHSASILVLNGSASRSHLIWHMELIKALAARGHNITVLSADIDPKPPANVTYLHMEGVYEQFSKENDIELIGDTVGSPSDSVKFLWDYAELACVGCLWSNGVRQLLAYPDQFQVDLILYDYTLGPCLLGFQHKFNYPPVVGITAFNIPAHAAEIWGGHNYYAYVPLFALNYDSVMTFWQRVENTYLYAYDYILRTQYFLPTIQKMATTIFGPDLPNLRDIERKAVLAFVNAHPSIDVPEPLPPNIIAVGGLQTRPSKPLPYDIETFINSSRVATVYFALGTNVRSDKLGLQTQLALLKAFGRMTEYNFLWKFETDSLPAGAIPKNVLLQPWLPQNDILAHPKVRAFITHAGTLSMHEATWHAVPMIAVPFVIDQIRSSDKAMRDGVAVRINYADLISDELVEKTVRQVLEDPRYQANMDKRSRRFRDQPEHPLQRSVWWVEYVLRHPDAEHLQSPAKSIGAFAANLWDMYLVVLLVAVLMTVIICNICYLLSLFKKSIVQDQKKKRN